MPDATSPTAERDAALRTPAVLPDESLVRLSELATQALVRAASRPDAVSGDHLQASVSVAVLSAEMLQDTAVHVAVRDGDSPVSVPAFGSAVRSFVSIPLREADGTLMAPEEPPGSGYALCVGAPVARDWTDAELAALGAVAATAAVEVRLRTDVARLSHAAEQARIAALHDPVTDLANRELFLDRLEMAVLRHLRYKDRHFAVMSLSIEQLHGIQASFGYDAAQELLREFANRLRTVVRNYDSIGRLGADEFGVLLESIRDESDAARVANRVHEALRTPVTGRADHFLVTANIGIVLSFAGVDTAARMTQLAGLARGRARHTGAPYEIFDPLMQQHAQSRISKEMDLRRAVDAREFELHYQPIISLDTGRIAHSEALIRWRHPQRGLVSAGEFIGLAEETGLAVPLGWFSISSACRQLRDWREQLPAAVTQTLGVSVNVTAAHFRQRDVADQVMSILEASGISGGISLEVTERMLIGNPADAAAVLNELRSLGVGVHLDDFGTGYSSLQYLHELPLDAIKIDRSFTARLRNGGRDAKMVGTIRELARQLGVPVIAEGVETLEDLGLVRDLGCEYAQGWLFAKALPAADFAALLISEPSW